jgi:hypothetical protein
MIQFFRNTQILVLIKHKKKKSFVPEKQGTQEK